MHGTGRHAPSPHRPGRPRPGLLLCAGLLVAAGATAQVERTGDYLARMDTDGDGHISPAEYVAWMGYAFERMDTDGDGVLATAELPGGKGKPITLEEHRRRLAERFVRQDANKDGYLDARELAAPPL